MVVYLECCCPQVEIWQHGRSGSPLPRKRWAEDYVEAPPTFPSISVMLLLPCALLAAFGHWVPVTGGVLVGEGAETMVQQTDCGKIGGFENWLCGENCDFKWKKYDFFFFFLKHLRHFAVFWRPRCRKSG